jgi:UDP-glucuronate 4-epimerase
MKALVTGVAGFVGSAIARRLIADGFDVVGVDAVTDYYDVLLKRQNLKSIPAPDFVFHEGDLNRVDLDRLLEGVDYIFHQAGQPGVRKSWGADFSVYTEANVNATQKLLEAAKRSATLKRFVYASSSSVYGDAERYPTAETDRPQPKSPYGVTKLAAEHLCSLYAENFGVPTVSLRYFTVYGPGQRPDMAFTRFVRASLTDDEITLYGTGEQLRDFTFVDDVVEANVRAALGHPGHGAVYNVAGGSNTSVNQVFSLLESLSGSKLRIKRAASVAGDVFRTGGSTNAIHEDLGWEPTIGLEEGLARHLEWGKRMIASENLPPLPLSA